MGKGGAKCSLEKIAKSGIFITNILFLILGVIVMISGGVALGEAKAFESDAEIFGTLNLRTAAAILLATGISCVIVALMGMLGSYKRYPTLLKLYVVLMFAIVVLQFGLGIYINRVDVEDQIRTEFLCIDPPDVCQENRLAYQNYLLCCGWDDPLIDTISLGDPICPYHYYGNTQTCQDATEDWIAKYGTPIAKLVIVLGVFELFALMMSCYIIMTAKTDTDDYFNNPFHY